MSGTTGDPGATVRVNGILATKSGTAFQASVPLQEGNNTLTAVAENTNKTQSTASVQVTLDTTPPKVTVDSPPSGFTTTDASITVTGMVNDIVVGTVNDKQAQVTVGGVAAQVSNRTFTATPVPLQLGLNTIPVIARDQTGNSATLNIRITREAATGSVIKIIAGNNQSGTIGSALAAPLVVQLLDGPTPLANTHVFFKITENDGFLQPGTGKPRLVTVITNAQGQAQATLTLGNRAGGGNNTVEAYASNVKGTAIFTASGKSKGGSHINVDSGTNQFGAVNQALPLPFVVVVTDEGFNRLAGVPVTFTVRQGNGSINGVASIQTVTDSDGRALATLKLGTQPGQDNNVVEATFTGNTGFPAAFTASGKVPGNPALTTISGVVQDNSNNPISNVTMRLFKTNQGTANNQPVEIGTPVKTDAKGLFKITAAPVGFFKLMADGTTATQAGKQFPTLEYDIVTVAGQDNGVGSPIYLPELDPNAKLCVDATTGGVLKLSKSPGFSLSIAPGSATFPGGSKTGCVSVTPVNPDKVPMVPGFGQQPRFVVTIQPVGTTFNPSAAISMPNMDGLAPNAKTEMYSFDHDLASFVAIGTGTVSLDGSTIVSDPGVGVIKAGWHCGGNPNTTGSAGTCPECYKCEGNQCQPIKNASMPCDDKDKCTADDQCKNGACVGEPVEVKITASSETICVGRSKQFVATTKPSGRAFNWSATSNANVTKDGVVSGISVGQSTITATDQECSKASDSWTARIMDKKSSADGPGETRTCLTRFPSCSTAKDLQNEIDPPKDQGKPTWISTNFMGKNPGDCRANREGSEMDAATHAYLACRMHRALDSSDAKAILDSHEFEHPEDSCESHEMDFNNNEVGRQLSQQTGDCTDLVFDQLNSGGLQVNNPFAPGICKWKGNGL